MIRPATNNDLPRIVAMTAAFLAGTRYGEVIAFDPLRVAQLAEALIDGAGVIFVAEVRGRLVGMLPLAAVPHPLSGELMAEELAWWVDVEYRNGTVGPRLLCAGEEWARQIGATVLKMVAPAETDIGTFYDRRGYSPLETAYIKRL